MRNPNTEFHPAWKVLMMLPLLAIPEIVFLLFLQAIGVIKFTI